jgi:hypothetical protein
MNIVKLQSGIAKSTRYKKLHHVFILEKGRT